MPQWPNQFPFNSTAKVALRMHQNSPFELKNRKIVWGGAPPPVGRGTPSTHPTPSILVPTAIDTCAFGIRPPNLQQKSPPLSRSTSCTSALDVRKRQKKKTNTKGVKTGVVPQCFYGTEEQHHTQCS